MTVEISSSSSSSSSIPSMAHPNPFKSLARKLYHPLGFNKGYNFTFCTSPQTRLTKSLTLNPQSQIPNPQSPIPIPIKLTTPPPVLLFAGSMTLFSLLNLPKLAFHTTFCGSGPGGTLPGECYWYLHHRLSELGIRIHLACILPAGILACMQFLPVVRRRYPRLHRANGYLVTGLAVLGNLSAMVVARHAAGGTLETQAACGVLFVMTSGSLGWGVWCARKGWDRMHREWMLRCWFYVRICVCVVAWRGYLTYRLCTPSLDLCIYSMYLSCGRTRWDRDSIRS